MGKITIMRKIITLLFAAVLITSCDINENPITLTASSTVVEVVPVSIPQTNGTSVAYDHTVNQDLNEAIANFSDVTNIEINSFSYQYKNVTGNTDAVIESASIIINGNTASSISSVNIAQEANNGTVFSITDQALLSQLESIFLNSASVNIQFIGSAISDVGPVEFEIEVTIDLTVTLN